MKIGTDGVLLGTWTNLDLQPQTILDIGAGTGVLSLMLAQRSPSADLEAIEIDEAAYEQCVENFEASPWADRLFCYHAGLDEFMDEMEHPYDLIISNPPFYAEQVSSGDAARDRARQKQSLPFEELLQGVAKLLAPEGLFSTIIPYKEEADFIALAASFGLFPNRILRVRGNPSAALKRSLLEFRFKATKTLENELTIEVERHVYTEAYIDLTKAFYLHM